MTVNFVLDKFLSEIKRHPGKKTAMWRDGKLIDTWESNYHKPPYNKYQRLIDLLLKLRMRIY